MILGTACSTASIIMGEIAERRLNITQVQLCIVTVVGCVIVNLAVCAYC